MTREFLGTKPKAPLRVLQRSIQPFNNLLKLVLKSTWSHTLVYTLDRGLMNSLLHLQERKVLHPMRGEKAVR